MHHFARPSSGLNTNRHEGRERHCEQSRVSEDAETQYDAQGSTRSVIHLDGRLPVEGGVNADDDDLMIVAHFFVCALLRSQINTQAWRSAK
uniref:Uncharacterized protein n=1 Tax=Steinernema glaseri TaxID=37863 RepID=A0A1I7YGM3_9BILA